MTIETKFIIGLLILMFIGSFTASFMGNDQSAVNGFITSFKNFSASFQVINIQSVGNMVATGGSFLLSAITWFGSCLFWNFAFFKGFEWLQVTLIFINAAIIFKLVIDLYRALKPFGA